MVNSKSLDGSVGIVTGWTSGARFTPGAEIFSSAQCRDRLWGPNKPPIKWVLAILTSEVKRPGRQSDHSPPFNAEVKNGGNIPPLLPIRGVVINSSRAGTISPFYLYTVV
jgi:hypothetical protein